MKSVIVVPLCGEGSRMPRDIYFWPKPMIRIDHRSIIEWTMDSIDYEGAELVFIVRKEHVDEFSIDSFLRQKFTGAKIVIAQKPTEGAVATCILAKEHINPEAPLFIHCSDVLFSPKICARDFNSELDGIILTFKSNSKNYSYSRIENGLVKEVAEKTVIGDQASAGLYWFKKGSYFTKAAKRMMAESRKTNNEYFIAPAYNLLIEEGKKIGTIEVDSISIFGTREEFDFFKKNILKSFPQNKKVVAVCSDHSGFAAKEIFKSLAEKRGLHVLDFGTHDTHDTDYSVFVRAACDSILSGVSDFGFGFCRSGQGVNIAANKVKGIRSALCYNEWAAEYAVKHSCANFFAVSEKFCDEKEINLILEKVMTNSFQGGRHQTRLMNSAE